MDKEPSNQRIIAREKLYSNALQILREQQTVLSIQKIIWLLREQLEMEQIITLSASNDEVLQMSFDIVRNNGHQGTNGNEQISALVQDAIDTATRLATPVQKQVLEFLQSMNPPPEPAVQKPKESEAMPESFLQLRDYCHAHMDDTRLRVILLLMRREVLSVEAICSAVGQSQTVVSHHLAILSAQGYASFEKSGKHHLYALTEKYYQAQRIFAQLSEDIVEECFHRARADYE